MAALDSTGASNVVDLVTRMRAELGLPDHPPREPSCEEIEARRVVDCDALSEHTASLRLDLCGATDALRAARTLLELADDPKTSNVARLRKGKLREVLLALLGDASVFVEGASVDAAEIAALATAATEARHA